MITVDPQHIEKIRQIRSQANVSLKPSPFLRSSYIDDSGEELPVKLRNYQMTGIMNLLMSPQMILGDGTGLGKSLEILSTIGYVWLKEPEYVPIVLAKKSALHQWANEVDKFMQGMEAMTIDGSPHDREQMYEDFFQSYDPNRKRLLILTYDVLLKDAQESVVRDTDHKASPADKKALANARKSLKEVQKAVKLEAEDFEKWFNNRPYEIWDHAKSAVAVGGVRPALPNNWCQDDEDRVKKYGDLLAAEQSWKNETGRLEALVHPTVIAPGIMGHIRAFQARHPSVKFMLVMDEAHVVKNHRGKIHASAADLAKCCQRIYGLTATPVKNRLMEFFALFRVVLPGLFPKVTWFQNEYCITKLQRIGGGRSVPIVVGYKNLPKFVEAIEPFYLSRCKYDVAAELPRLVTRELQCELTDLQEELYDMAEAGLLEKDADPDSSSAAVLGAMTYVQEAVDAPNLLNNAEGEPFEGNSPKIDVLLEQLEDELDGVKTIVFSRFERMISLTEKALKDKGVKCVRITGKENKASDREKAKAVFQDPKSGTNVILITEAGSESINLQAAEHFILLDSPWSYGTYVQLIGRMIRIGSKHSMTVATHLVAVRKDGRKTIDHYVIKKLKSKKALADQVAGEGLKDGLKFVPENDAMELVSMIKRGLEVPSKPLASQKGGKTRLGGAKGSGMPSRGKESHAEDSPPAVATELDLSEI
jgi:SNF2 family DNA or RNA helicase